MHVSHFFWISSRLVARDILLVAGCPLCNSWIFRRFLGTMILSSINTRPNRLDSFFLCARYSSGFRSCCWRSRHTRAFFFSRFGSLVVSVMRSWWSVENFFMFLLPPVLNPNFCLLPLLFLVRVPFLRIGHSWLRRSMPNLLPVLRGLMGLGLFRSLFLLLPWESVCSVRPCLMLEVEVPGWSYLIGCTCVGRCKSQNGSTVHSSVRVFGWKPPLVMVQSVGGDLLVVCRLLSVVIFLRLLFSLCEEISAHGISSIFLLSSGKCRVWQCLAIFVLIQWFLEKSHLLQCCLLFLHPF